MFSRSRFVHDVRHAARLLRNNPGFSAVAIATVALALGANTAMFSVVNGLFLRPLPYPEPDRIVRVLERLPSGALNAISTLDYLDWASQNTVFEHMAAEAGWSATLTGGDEPILIRGARVSPAYFEIFAVQPALGRTFLPDDGQPGNDRVVLLTHALWRSRFGADPSVLGRALVLDGEPHTVVGVLPADGPFDRAAARIWRPLAFDASQMTRDFRWLSASATLEPGVTIREAQAEMDVIAQRLADAYPASNAGRGIAVDRLADVVTGPDLESAVSMLFVATAFVLLIGCANLANLALVRSVAREREMTVRAALGARRWQLVRQVLIENVVLGVCGGVAGAVVGYVLLRWIQSLIPPDALAPAVHIGMDASVVLFALAAAIATGLLFGLAPALQATDSSLVSALRDGCRGTTTGGRGMRSGLVVAEIAIAFVLLVAAGLMMRSFFNLLDVDPGFTAAGVLTAGLPVTQQSRPDPAELDAYLEAIREAVDAVPGVQGTAVTSALPLQGWGFGMPYAVADRGPDDRRARRSAFFKIVSPSYFDVLGITLRTGRVLREADAPGAPRVAVINETLARREFPDDDPIGRRLVVQELVPGGSALGEEVAWEIVGVVAGERITGLGEAISAGMYVSHRQSPTYRLDLIVRADVPPASLQTALRGAVDGVNRNQALSDVRTLEQIVDASMLGNRVTSLLFASFAGIALLLAAVGLYGVLAYTTAQRTHELGIRAALGAGAGDLRLLIIRAGARLTGIGLAIGLGAAIVVTRAMASMLYDVDANDPLTIVAVAAVLAGVAGVACWVPAWRITRLDPIEALRTERA